MDDDAFPVTDNQQLRVLQLEGVGGELLEGSGQVAARFLVLPAKAATLPHIRPAIATIGFFGPALKAVVFRVARLINPEQFAQIVEMLLGAGPFVEPVVFPERDKVFGGHGDQEGFTLVDPWRGEPIASDHNGVLSRRHGCINRVDGAPWRLVQLADEHLELGDAVDIGRIPR